jgi:uncharacterized protein (DUF433 family)
MTATAPAPQAQIERTEHPHVIKGGALGGQPRIDDQRISVLILLDYYESGASIDEILENYPSVSKSELLDALSYAYDHPDEMEYWRERQTLRSVLKRTDTVYVDGRLVPRAGLDRIEIPEGAKVYTWETLPAELEN